LNGTLPQWVLGQKAMEYAYGFSLRFPSPMRYIIEETGDWYRYLGGNQFSGSIPDNIPNTSALVEMYVLLPPACFL